MAESRRVPLTTLSPEVSASTCGPEPVLKFSSGVPRERENGSDRPPDTETVRLVLTLFEPDKRSFPEFNYCQLIDNKTNQVDVQQSRFGQEEKREQDEVAAIARKLEEKYGGNHKKRDRIQDLIDIGYGYDEEDSFIDNSEAYDEFVPYSITTKFGGFYVNSGVLQFRQVSDLETEFSAEEELFQIVKDKPKKRSKASGEVKSTTDPKLRTLSKIGEVKIKKKKKTVKTLSVTNMLKKFRREKEKERRRREHANQITAHNLGSTTPPMFPADAAGGGCAGLTDPLLSLIGSTNDHALIQAASTVDFDIDLDSLLDVSENLSPKSVCQTAAEAHLIQSKTESQIQQSNAEPHVLNIKAASLLKPQQEQVMQPSVTSLPPVCFPLPEGLPPRLEESIRRLMVAAKTSEGESKLKFFSPDINAILLDIELQCQEQSVPLRSRIYRHLSSFMPCSKDTLLKRVKKLLVTHEEEPLIVEDSLQKLKDAIERSMPEQIACFHQNCQAYEQLKTSKSAEEENVEERGGRRGGPKKMFKWNQEIRDSLGHVLREKMEKCKKEGSVALDAEDYFKTLIDNEVKPLWPKGWMQSRVLIRESRKLLGPFNSVLANKTRQKRQTSISGASKSSHGCCSLQGAPAVPEVPRGTEGFTEGSNIFSFVVQDEAASANPELPVELTARPSLSHGEKPLVNVPPAPAHSFLDILAEQALAHEFTATLTQRVLAAVGKHWNFSEDTSPPLPPPPPQSSPLNFPESSADANITTH